MTTQRLKKTVLSFFMLGCLAVAGPAMAAFDFEFHVPAQGAVTGLGEMHQFHTTVTNTGDEADSYTVSIVKNIPLSWACTLCQGLECFPPWITEITFDLAPGEETNVDIDITPVTDVGYGSVNVTVTSGGNPSLRPNVDFTVVSTGLDLLLVVDDTTDGLADYYTEALVGSDKNYGVWKQVEMGPLSNLELMEFPTVVWSAGEIEAALNTDTMGAMAYYVQHGGNLFLNGRDLAYESCDPGSPFYSTNSHAWFSTILSTDYTGSVASSYASAQGVSGDPITSNLSFGLSGGDGADNTAHTLDGLTPVGSGMASLQYFDQSAGEMAAVRSLYGDGMTYFAGFAFEAIDNASDRTALMHGVLDWFDGLLIPAQEEIARPLLASPAYAAPNPFNPQTSIKFEVGGQRDVQAEVVVYDLRGQAVRSLFSGTVSPGLQDLVWNGRDDDGRTLSTGVYLAQVKLDGAFADNVKMTLAK